MPDDRKIAVIGGGPAGCCAAWLLHESEFHVELFEKEPFLGGRTHTWREGDLAINTGAGFFTNFYPLLWEILAELGLSRQIRATDKAIVLSDTRQQYAYQLSSIRSFFGIPWLSLGDKLRVIRHTVGLLLNKTRHDLVDPQRLSRFDQMSIADYARSRLGKNVFDYLIRAAIEPYWYFSCEDASAAMLMALQAEAPGAQFYTLNGGMDLVCTHLAQEIPQHLGIDVTEISRTATGQFQLTIGDTPQDTLFDGIILATPAPAAHQLVKDLPEEIVSTEQCDFLHSQKYAANINVWYQLGAAADGHCGFQLSPVGRDWHGIAAWTDLGSVHQESLPTEDRVAGAYLLHESSLRLMDAPDDRVQAETWQALRRFQPDLPPQPPPLVRVHRRRDAIPIPEVGRYRQAAAFQQNQRPPVVFAGDYLATATIEGALQTGRIAADLFCD